MEINKIIMKFRIDGIRIEYLEKPKVKNGLFIQGLLGVGQIGMLAARQLIDSLGARKIANVYSSYFLYPGVTLPGIIYDEAGSVDLEKNEIFFDEKNGIFILTGIYQGTIPESYYSMANAIMDFCDEAGVDTIYTIGGYGTGKNEENPRVLGIIADDKLSGVLEKHDVGLLRAPAASIGATGLAGILIPYGHKNGLKCISFLGETEGSYPDAKAAKRCLQKVAEVIGIEVVTDKLDEEIDALEKEFKKIESYTKKMQEMSVGKDEERLHYIG